MTIVTYESSTCNVLGTDLPANVVSIKTKKTTARETKEPEKSKNLTDLEKWIHQEFIKGSGISTEIVAKCVQPLTDKKAISKVLNWTKYTNDHGGALMRSLDLNTMQISPVACQFKPRYPLELSGKPAKYVTPKGLAYDAIAANFPDRWQAVLDDPSIPVILTEGVKKALALETLGHPSLALIGVWNGQITDKKTDRRELVPNLAKLAVVGRPFTLCFDADIIRKDGVRQALTTLATELKRKGCIIHVAVWDESDGKGIDDYFVKNGEESTNEILANALQYKDWLNQTKVEPQEKKEKESAPLPENLWEMELDCTDSTLDVELFNRVWSPLGIRMKNGKPWVYNPRKGVWEPISDIRRNVSGIVHKAFTVKGKEHRHVSIGISNLGKSAQTHCEDMSKSLQESINHSNPKIAFKNGTLHLNQAVLKPYDKEDEITHYIDADYIPDCECPPNFKAFIESSYGNSDVWINFIRAIIRYYLDYSLWGKFVHFIGNSRTGKGTMIRLIQSLFEEGKSTSQNTLDVLNTPEDRHAHLSGKLLMTFPDMTGFLKCVQPLYELVDNGSLSGRARYRADSYNEKWGCKFLFASTESLGQDDSGRGWRERVIVVQTKQRDLSKTDTDLREKLESERHEIISWAIAMTRVDCKETLWDSERHPEECIDAKQESDIGGNSAKLFIDQCLRPKSGVRIDSESLIKVFDAYKLFCQYGGYGQMAFNNFLKSLKTLGDRHFSKRKNTTILGSPISIPASYFDFDLVEGLLSYGNFQPTKQISGGLAAFESFKKQDLQDNLHDLHDDSKNLQDTETQSQSGIDKTYKTYKTNSETFSEKNNNEILHNEGVPISHTELGENANKNNLIEKEKFQAFSPVDVSIPDCDRVSHLVGHPVGCPVGRVGADITNYESATPNEPIPDDKVVVEYVGEQHKKLYEGVELRFRKFGEAQTLNGVTHKGDITTWLAISECIFIHKDSGDKLSLGSDKKFYRVTIAPIAIAVAAIESDSVASSLGAIVAYDFNDSVLVGEVISIELGKATIKWRIRPSYDYELPDQIPIKSLKEPTVEQVIKFKKIKKLSGRD